MKNRFFQIKIELSMLLSFAVALYLMFDAHNANIENAEKMNRMLSKYEQQLDTLIVSDENTLKTYKQNIDKAVNSLSEEERQFIMRILEVDTQN